MLSPCQSLSLSRAKQAVSIASSSSRTVEIHTERAAADDCQTTRPSVCPLALSLTRPTAQASPHSLPWPSSSSSILKLFPRRKRKHKDKRKRAKRNVPVAFVIPELLIFVARKHLSHLSSLRSCPLPLPPSNPCCCCCFFALSNHVIAHGFVVDDTSSSSSSRARHVRKCNLFNRCITDFRCTRILLFISMVYRSG